MLMHLFNAVNFRTTEESKEYNFSKRYKIFILFLKNFAETLLYFLGKGPP